jgi:DNA-binding IclR family transcriptional regulator
MSHIVRHNGRGRGPSIKILDKTFRVLAAFTAEAPVWALSPLAGQVGLAKSTAHRILTVLEANRYVAREADAVRFRLGPAALELGRRAQIGTDLRRLALPVLRRVASKCGERVFLLVPNLARDGAICIERVESSMGLRLIAEIGAQVPLHAGASAKALLAHMKAQEIERLITRGLKRLGPGTITNPAGLRRDLAKTRRRGWAFSIEETDEGATGIAVPVLGPGDEVVASLAIAGPLARVTRQHRARLVALARSGASEIAAMLVAPVEASAHR